MIGVGPGLVELIHVKGAGNGAGSIKVGSGSGGAGVVEFEGAASGSPAVTVMVESCVNGIATSVGLPVLATLSVDFAHSWSALQLSCLPASALLQI